MIKEIYIKNYKSIKEVTIEPESLCALIGPNSSGKSNVLKAIDLVLGEGWTTKAKVARELFNDILETIEIVITLSNTIPWNYFSYTKSIKTVSLEMNYQPLDCKVRLWENYPNDKNGDGYFLNEDFKRQCHFIYIPSVRDLRDEMRVSNWTLLGRLMKLVYENYIKHYGNEDELKKIFQGKIKEAKDFLEDDFTAGTDEVSFKKFYDTFKGYCVQNSAGIANSFEPYLNIYNPNWFYKTLQISVKESHCEKEFDAEEIGSGMQNLILLSIFQTYAELSRGKAILAIEEPELFLYPQAQRELYHNFQQLSEKSQIFYTTHNPNFLDAQRAYEIEMLYKDNKDGTKSLQKNTKIINKVTLKEAKFKIYTHFTTERNEIFFAKYVILVEGASDKILWTTLIEDKWEIQIDKLGISIVECGGKGGVIYFIGVLRLMGIENFFAVWDKDEAEAVDTYGHLQYAIDNKRGLEIAPNLEDFLKKHFTKHRFSDEHKVEDAYAWASGVDKDIIPKEFNVIKENIEDTFVIW